MAIRPVFIALAQAPYVQRIDVEFAWFPGFALSQKQKSIAALHGAVTALRPELRPLEISTKSNHALGRSLSAFTQRIAVDGREVVLECAFQGSKSFAGIGVHPYWYDIEPGLAKRAANLLHEKHALEKFVFDGREFPLEPKTLFYDWLYIRCVLDSTRNIDFAGFDAFTDIEFNPEKSLNCQAFSAALLCSLLRGRTPAQVLAMTREELATCVSAAHGGTA